MRKANGRAREKLMLTPDAQECPLVHLYIGDESLRVRQAEDAAAERAMGGAGFAMGVTEGDSDTIAKFERRPSRLSQMYLKIHIS